MNSLEPLFSKFLQKVFSTLRISESDFFLEMDFFLRRHIFRLKRNRDTKRLVKARFERSKEFIEYAKQKVNLKDFLEKFDEESQIIIKRFFQRLLAIYTNKLKAREDFLSLEEKKDLIKLRKQKFFWEKKHLLPLSWYEGPVFFNQLWIKVYFKKNY